MKYTTYAAAIAAFSSPALSTPLARRQAPPAPAPNVTDIDVLQFALTLEHLENVYYKQNLARFSQQDFMNAGFSQQYYSNVQFVAHDEEAHVNFLTAAISAAGAQPVAACTYNFPVTDVQSFVGLGNVLEGVGVSAYLGGAPVITSKDILTQAGAILVSEGLHQAVQRQSLNETVSANIVGTPVGPNSVFTLASAFIQSCPQTNPPLPFKAFPALTAVTKGVAQKQSMFQFTAPPNAQIPDPLFVTYVSGLDTVSVVGSNQNGMLSAAIPAKTEGQTYVFVTNNGIPSGSLMDSQILMGPAIVEVSPDPPSLDFNVQK